MNGPLVPFRQLVLKVHSRCDLACDHCYVYEHQDYSGPNRPIAIWVVTRPARLHQTIGSIVSHALIGKFEKSFVKTNLQGCGLL
jgi:hypothetical protein